MELFFELLCSFITLARISGPSNQDIGSSASRLTVSIRLNVRQRDSAVNFSHSALPW